MSDVRSYRRALWLLTHQCALCKTHIETYEDATIDHIIPKSRGGRTEPRNLQLAHKHCNLLKGNNVSATQYVKPTNVTKNNKVRNGLPERQT